MCGIAGAFRPQGQPVSGSDVLRAMSDRIRHRGPDGDGVWREPQGRCGLAHRRLSIIDLSDSAAQPMSSPDGRAFIVFNGEIYNHAQVRRELEQLGHTDWRTDHSDTEVLLRAYLQWGLPGLHRLVGMFAFAIYDARDPQRPVLHLVRDRLGVKPLYLARTKSGEWLFASEIRALCGASRAPPRDGRGGALALPDVHRRAGAAHAVPRRLQAARGARRQHRWRRPCERRRVVALRPGAASELTDRELSAGQAVAELSGCWCSRSRGGMVSDVPVGVLLSGGVDSA